MSDDTEYPSWYPAPEGDVSPESQQQAIIDSDAYPMRVLAGAGTGKTFTMVRKIEHLIDEITDELASIESVGTLEETLAAIRQQRATDPARTDTDDAAE